MEEFWIWSRNTAREDNSTKFLQAPEYAVQVSSILFSLPRMAPQETRHLHPPFRSLQKLYFSRYATDLEISCNTRLLSGK